MAGDVGFGASIDLSALDEAINKANQGLKNLTKQSRATQDAVIRHFQSMSEGVHPFLSKINQATTELKRMGGSVNLSFNIEQRGGIGAIGQQATATVDSINKLTLSLSQLQQLLSTSGVGDSKRFAQLNDANNTAKKTFQQLERETKKMNKSIERLDKAQEGYATTTTQLITKLQNVRRAQEEYNRTLKEASTQDAGNLLAKRTSHTTLNELKQYSEQIKKTMANLDPKTKEWRELNGVYRITNSRIKEINDSMNVTERSHSKLLNHADQLRRALALVFSVSQITGYMRQLVNVRGEFELQQRALQAIVQNVDEANRLWEKTVALAVRSPFRVKELVTYTKQLSAYRVETDKLYDTTKMLADVSAGLGIDMNRLILAYGQVKAANYLRGTELRQFSEAGINILGELATYFTELEGRAVSVGDVFERVSKRMVAFSDVEEIFKRITSEGGIFYNMQEIQAETLKGQMSNLRDSIDIMLNDIGKENEDTIKGLVAFMRNIVENWRAISTILSAMGTALLVVALNRGKDAMAAKVWTAANLASTAAGKGFNATIAKMILSFKGLWSAMLSNPMTAFVMALSALGVVVYKAVKRQNELNRAYEEHVGQIYAQSIETKKYSDSILELITRQKELIEANKDLTEDSEEYKENQEELSSIENERKEILNELIKIDPEYANTIKKAGNDLSVIIPLTEEYNERLRTRLALEASLKNFNSEEFTKDYNRATTKQQSALGELESTYKFLIKEANELLSSDYVLWEDERKAIEQFVNGSEPYYKRAIQLYNDLKAAKRDEDITPLEESMMSRWGTRVDLLSQYFDTSSIMKINKYIKSLKKVEKKEKDFITNMENLAKDFMGTPDGVRLTSLIADAEATQEDKDKAKNQIITYFEDVLDEKGYVGSIADKARTLWSSIFRFDWNKKSIVTPLVGWRKEYNDLVKTFTTGAVKAITQEDNETEYIDTLKKDYETYAKVVEGWDAGNAKLRAQYNATEIENIRLANEERRKAIDWLVYESDSGDGENKALKDLNERIKLVQELNKEYENLNKTFSKSESITRVKESYRDAWDAIMPKDISLDLFDFTSQTGVVAQLELLKNKLPQEAIDLIKTIEKAIAGERVEIDVDFKKGKDKELISSVESLFDKYDLTLELKKLNIPPDLAKSLFDIDYLDLGGLREAVQEQKAKFIGADMDEEYEEFLEKINEMERKDIVERTKTYAEYLTRGMNERVKLKVEELRKLKELEESKEFSDEQKAEIRKQIQIDSNKELDKQWWDRFRGTELYTMMFEDLEVLGTQSIKNLYDHLEKLKGNLSHLDASEVKEIVNQMEKLQEEMIARNPFEAFRKAQKDIMSVGEDEQTLLDRLFNKEKIEAEAQSMIDSISAIERAFADDTFEQLRDDDKALFESFMPQFAEGKDLASIKKGYQDILDDAKDGKDLTAEQLKNFADYRKALQGISDYWGEMNGQVQNIVGSVKEIMGAFGADEISMALADSVGNMSTLITQAVQFGIQMQVAGYAANMALGVIGWIAIAIQAITTVISAIANVKNARIDAQLEDQAKLIERQRDLYEEIEERVDKAYDVGQLRQYNDEMKRSVELEIQALEASIALEKSRKKVDEEQVKDYENQIAEARERLAESTQGMMEELNGIFDLSDFTSGFIDAWWDAMDEGKKGLDALNEHFEETMKDMVKKQALYRGAQEIMSQVQDAINKSLEGDYTVDEAEWQAIMDAAKKANVNLDAFLQGWYDMFGAMSDGAGGGLSALQKGIHNLSESTGQVLESLLNSLRFYVADSNSELKSQTKYMRDMYNMLSSMTASHSQGGRGIKVVM